MAPVGVESPSITILLRRDQRGTYVVMALAKLLGDMTLATFIQQYFLRLPCALPNQADAFQSLGSWEVLAHLVAQPESDLLVVRDGQHSECGRPNNAEDVRGLLNDGHTVLIRHAERGHAGLSQLAAEFSSELGAPVDVHLYATPGGRHGFGWHYDVEDVFILQTAGIKEYLLRKNTVNPWPILETLPANMRYGREIMPVMRCELQAGDWLYIPHGYWHCAQARTDSLSLAVGVAPPTGLDVLAFAKAQLLDSMRWRQRLPVHGAAADGLPNENALRQRLAELADDLQMLLKSPAFERSLLEHLGGHVNADAAASDDST